MVSLLHNNNSLANAFLQCHSHSVEEAEKNKTAKKKHSKMHHSLYHTSFGRSSSASSWTCWSESFGFLRAKAKPIMGKQIHMAVMQSKR